MKKFGILAAASILLFLLFPNQARGVVSFDDVPMNHQFVWEIIYLHEQVIIDGYPDGTFRPYNKVTRSQAMKMIGEGIYLYKEKRATPFSDVPENAYYSGYVMSAYEQGYISGYSDGTFRPHSDLTRGQAALIFSRAFKWAEAPPSGFSDVSGNSEMSKAVAKLKEHGVTTGYPDGTFRPNEKITRGQFAAFLARAIEPSFVPQYQALLETSNEILAHLQNKEFDQLANYMGEEPLTFCPYAGNCIDHGGVQFSESELDGFMDDSTVYYWGDQDGSGFPIELTPAEYDEEWLMEADYEAKYRYDRSKHFSTQELIRQKYPAGRVVEYYFEGTSEYDYMDWQSLNLVFEKNSSGEWVLIAIVNDRWTI
ncbi:S-layer homology domain-containing protein [Jeotgalibacillus salarius]|uniref:S-layer homology domain-containing protein n=1 Tax=Jeotgalibacillus salarius TaxID=546023 RepID=A0A4Y8LJ19_9BACL|nr:S-layer homology domain-containing protein [Jeotgalibacillus salarius]TFE02195.1 S-layer homology domain-containing protein [Jeotgalibacillus salarius]